MQVQRTFKKREGVWGIVKGDKGGASQVAPPVPLDERTTFGFSKEILAIVIASKAKQSTGKESPMILALHTVDCHARAARSQ